MGQRGDTPPKRRNDNKKKKRVKQKQQTLFPKAINIEGDTSSSNSRQSSSGDMHLLPGWTAATDNKSGNTYYFNQETGERTWDWRKVISQAPVGRTMYTSRRSDPVTSGRAVVNNNNSRFVNRQERGSQNKNNSVPKRPGGGVKDDSNGSNYSPRARRGRVKGGGNFQMTSF
jgi:hypothetical protein